MLVGTVLLLSMNLVRIITLYYAGIHFPNAFETLHVEVWQAVFIFVPIVLWVIWERFVARRSVQGFIVAT